MAVVTFDVTSLTVFITHYAIARQSHWLGQASREFVRVEFDLSFYFSCRPMAELGTVVWKWFTGRVISTVYSRSIWTLLFHRSDQKRRLKLKGVPDNFLLDE